VIDLGKSQGLSGLKPIGKINGYGSKPQQKIREDGTHEQGECCHHRKRKTLNKKTRPSENVGCGSSNLTSGKKEIPTEASTSIQQTPVLR
jgi:hypothetical protein